MWIRAKGEQKTKTNEIQKIKDQHKVLRYIDTYISIKQHHVIKRKCCFQNQRGRERKKKRKKW